MSDSVPLDQQQLEHLQYLHHTFTIPDHRPILGNPYISCTDTLYEAPAPVVVPPQTSFRPPSPSCHSMAISPHTGLLFQHTSDARFKETQYLRRQCFNCHATEPPSWRHSTLNPGKIICNKCGLYERAHMRPRPLRFDKPHTGNRARKQRKGTCSSKFKTGDIKEPKDLRQARGSTPITLSLHSGGTAAAGDWDNNSSTPSSFHMPLVSTYPIPQDSLPQCPPRDAGIYLPNNPLLDIASALQQPHGVTGFSTFGI